MFEIRFHGRGGQGVVSASEMLSVGAFLGGKHAQAFPSFGSERMGAPVVSFCRIDDKPIRSREPVVNPDALVIQDPTLLHGSNLFEGLADDGYILLNSTRDFRAVGLDELTNKLPPGHCCTVPAGEIALRHVGRPAPNAALLGALIALTDVVDLASVIESIRQKFPGSIGEKNVEAAKAAYECVFRSASERHTVIVC
jgi:pyruvate ferredoxin oxidoreductase gamma subunit